MTTCFLKISAKSIQRRKMHQNYMKNKKATYFPNMWNFGIWTPLELKSKLLFTIYITLPSFFPHRKHAYNAQVYKMTQSFL